ncbi:hypothetical protein BCD91_002690 [Clostridium beijerinckii]|uniref:hypothetical protein n=1 Tax=Clostridium beijerinckii TaxID=1520 RepID=UPI00149442D5|nr:hypothetical protein [Clostridium beijerinckii]NOW90667.1 hypothetical protein [Clostridium beijerinckii]
MGANVEITVYTRKNISFSRIIDFLSSEEISLTIGNVETIKDWEFTGCRKLSVEISDTIINQELNCNNIILIYAFANKNINCGVQIEYNKYGFYEYGFYLDTNSIGIDLCYINKHSQVFYNKIADAIKELIEPKDLIICGIGEETLVESHDDVNMIIEKSSFMERWILPNKIKINNYIESKYGELYIYDKKDISVVD